MDSQHIGNIVDEENAARAVQIDVVNPRGVTAPPNSRNDDQPRFNDREFDGIHNDLLSACQSFEVARNSACQSVEHARNILRDDQVYMASVQQAAEQERKARLDCTEAYARLHAQHGRAVRDLDNMSTKCVSLDRQLKQAENTISSYELTIADNERRSVAEYLARTEQLEAKIRGIEDDKATMMQKQESSLTNAANRIGGLEQKIHELEGEKQEMAQEHQVSLSNAAACISTAERKVVELEQRCCRQHALSGATEHISSRKRQKTGSSGELQDGPSRRLRRRGLEAPNDDDTIIVCGQ